LIGLFALFYFLLKNNFVFLRTGAVVEVGNPRQLYMYNTFENWDSRYEMRTRKRLLYE
jgi:hypothetical protein